MGLQWRATCRTWIAETTYIPRGCGWLPSHGMDNDSLHKFAYRHGAMFADLLRLAVPALAAELDFVQAQLLPTSHVSATGGRLEQRHGDMTWLVPHRRGTSSHLVAVVEFQSTVDSRMAERMRQYCRMQGERPTRRSLAGGPALLPLVVYNGSERWTAPGAVAELPAEWSAAARLALAPFQAWDYVLLSLEHLLAAGGGSLAHLPLGNRSAAALRLQAARTLPSLLARLRQEWVRFPGEADRPTREALHTWASALLANMAGADLALPTVDDLDGLEEPEGATEMTTVSQARLGKWFEDLRAEHLAQGIQQGMEQGIQQERARGLARLRRQAAIKFGAQTAEQLADLLGAAVAAEQMERAGDWIVECERGADLLARVATMRTNGGES